MKKGTFILLVIGLIVNHISFSQSKQEGRQVVEVKDHKDVMDGRWTMGKNNKEQAIVVAQPNNEIYRVFNLFTANGTNSNIKVKIEDKLLTLDNRPIWINEGTYALLEGKSIELIDEDSNNEPTEGGFKQVSHLKTGVIGGNWNITNNKKPSLIADLKNPRHFRINVNNISPRLTNGRWYSLVLYIDDVKVSDPIININSIDVYGSKIAILLESSSHDEEFYINGTYVSWL